MNCCRCRCFAVTCLLALTALFTAASSNAASPILADFNSEVSFSETGYNPPLNATWIPVNSGYGSTAEAGTMEGSPCLKIMDEGGFDNGVYAIFPNAVPDTGTYTVRCRIQVVENASTALVSYSIGCIVNGNHRVPPAEVAGCSSNFGRTPIGYLTTFKDPVVDPIYLQTTPFSATAGDRLLIALSSNVVDYYKYAGSNWGGSYVLIDDVQLLNTAPVSISGWTLE